MRELPTGTVTLLFSDIEGSTQLLKELGPEAYAEALAEHRRSMRVAFEAHGGVEIDTQGDAFFVAFPEARSALAAAAQAQAAFADGPVRVRMGIHSGEPLLTGEGYVGIDVHRGARVMSAGHGGQVLVSDATYALLDSDSGLTELGRHRLKDLTEPQPLYQLGEGEFPPLKTLYQTNLPVQPTPLVGREAELADVLELLSSGRLVTLTGAGGSGKTRLALQAAAELVDDYRDGVWWVSLAALRDPELVEPTIARVIGARDGLAEELRSRTALLLLDNFEQLLGAAPTIAELLGEALDVRVLATSRHGLGLAAEREYPVPTMTPDEAVALFTARARQVNSGYEASARVAEICRRLDGLPLAIELAAARTRVLSDEKLFERLESRLPLLTGGRRDLPERQRTLRSTIAWSYDLLDSSAQTLFSRVAVFADGFTLEAAEEVCDADLDAVQSLVEQSLVRQELDRFSMFETIREYALELLERSGEGEELRRKHAAYAVRLAHEAESKLRGPDQTASLDRLGAEHDNLRGALAWTLSGADVPQGQELAAALTWFWQLRSHLGEGQAWIEAALRSDAAPALRARLLQGDGQLAYYRGERASARVLLEQAVEAWRAVDTRPALAESLTYLGVAAGHDGDADRARSAGDEAVRVALEGDRWTLGLALWGLGANVALKRCEPTEVGEARTLLTESVRLLREVGDRWALGAPVFYLGVLEEEEGNLDAAVELFEESVGLFRQVGDKWRLLVALDRLGNVAELQGDQVRAQELRGEVHSLDQELGQLKAAPEHRPERVAVPRLTRDGPAV